MTIENKLKNFILQQYSSIREFTITNNIPYSTNQNLPTQNTISSDEAKQIALQHANLLDNQVTFIKVSQDYDDGIHIYEVEFYYNNREYNYDINAINGTILSYEQD